jgi:hypothetical protein
MATKKTTKKKPEPTTRTESLKASIPSRIARKSWLLILIAGIWLETIALTVLAAAALLPSSGVVRLLLAAGYVIIVFSPAYLRGPIAKNIRQSVALRFQRTWERDCTRCNLRATIDGKVEYPKMKVEVGPMGGFSDLVDAFNALTWRDVLRFWSIRLPITAVFKPDWVQYRVTPMPTQYDPKFRSHLEQTLRRLHKYKDCDSSPDGDDWLIILVMEELEEKVTFKMPVSVQPGAESADDGLVEQLWELPAHGEDAA